MPVRLAVFECPCCGGQTSLPLAPRRRAPSLRSCGNGGCWSCLGACGGMARLLEVVRLPDPKRVEPAEAIGPGFAVPSWLTAVPRQSTTV